jgi:DNA-binding NtrC family response regulator
MKMNRKPKVLVVDDEEIVRRSYTRLLNQARCSAEAASNGTEALRALTRQPFDVVLLDLRMPGADGLSVLKSIRSQSPEAEVIVITGYPTIETAKEAVRLGAYEYLAKPVEPDMVIEAAHGAAERKRWALRTANAEHMERSMQ